MYRSEFCDVDTKELILNGFLMYFCRRPLKLPAK